MLHVSGFAKNEGWRRAATACALAGAIALTGCGKKQEPQAVVGQVIAHVGPDDVTQQEVDNELRIANVPADKRSDAILKAALSRVIERKYLAQQAIAAKLDREPTVHLDLLRAREQMLASAFAERDFVAKASGISKSEVDSYVQGHPDQFAKRQVFQIEQISFPPQKDMNAITTATKDFKTLDQFAAKLNELGVKFSRGPGALDGATIPDAMLRSLEKRKPDDIFLLSLRQGVSAIKVISVEEKPLTGEDADRFGKQQLTQELASKNSRQSFDAALASAKYEGDYARIMAVPTPAANNQPAADAVAAPAGQAPAAAEKPAGEVTKEPQKN